MLDKILNSKIVIHKALEATWKRNEAIAQNISNVDTPEYKRKTVSFEEQLQEAMDNTSLQGRMTDRRHIPIVKTDLDKINIEVTQDNKNLSMRLDGNDVDIDAEMAALAKNTIQYNVLTQMAGYSNLKMVIKEGK